MQLILKSDWDVNNSQRRREMWDLDVASYDIGVSIAKIHQIYSGSENIIQSLTFNGDLPRRVLC